LENPHVINPNQVFVGVIKKGPSRKIALNSSYQNRGNTSYIDELGKTLVDISALIPDGVLVFFPSYAVMDSCIQRWQSFLVWDRIKAHKEPFVEPRDKQGFGKAIDTFYNKVSDASKPGAIFFAVCRGKASEGIDFSDTRARAVVITGIPFPSVADPRVKMKREYLDELHRDHTTRKTGVKSLSGQAWYLQQGARAVNQAIGRAIRHKDDWGAILLCDDRFASKDNIQKLPRWIRDQVTTYEDTAPAFETLSSFVNERKAVDATNPSRVKLKAAKAVAGLKENHAPGAISKCDNLRLKRKLAIGEEEHGAPVADVGAVILMVKSEDVRTNASNFLAKIRNALPRDEYKAFQKFIKDCKAKAISHSDMIAGIESVLGKHETYLLFRDCAQFMPSALVPMFLKRADELERRFKPLDPADQPAPQAIRLPCIVCSAQMQQPFQAPCRHNACQECWLKVLKVKQECPQCKAKTRPRQLCKLFFE
jgi:hypothetical protein